MAYEQNLVCFNTFGQEKSWSLETYEKNDGYQTWRKILAGKLYLSSALTERLLLQNLVAGNARQFASPIDKLSDRELQVFEQIGAGHSTTEIAKQLNLSVKTIETHRAHTKEKLNLKNSAELTRYALQWSLQVNRQMLSG